MFKKLMLVMIASSGFVRSEENNVGRNIALGAGAVVATGTVMYWSMRESNDVKIERAQDWLTYYSGNLHYDLGKITSVAGMQQFINQSTKFKKEVQVFCKGVHNSYAEMKSRYGSWIKPWNWTSRMKSTYQQIKELRDIVCMIEMMFKYQPLMTVYEADLDEAAIVRKTQAICHGASSYPMIYCTNMIHYDLYFLQKNHFKISCDIVLVDLLEKVLELIVNTQAYVEERRIQEEMAIKERQARAQEAQVAAQMAQANALANQARAQEERNRIERDKLNHKKNQ
jgi:hypothetical protein